MSVRASSFRQAVKLAVELRATGARMLRMSPPRAAAPWRREWTLELTAPEESLTMEKVERWEDELLELERRSPGCQFLGWRTRPPASADGESSAPARERSERPSERCDGAPRRRSTQRELVLASLLRCPTERRSGVVHGRGVPR
jgi:hypothetical protein